MKKLDLKSFGAGILCSAVVSGLGVPAVAAVAGSMNPNRVNIIANGETLSKAGESYTLQNGAKAPSSIFYTDEKGGGTVYLPVRRLSEALGVDIAWDGAQNAVVVEAEDEPAVQRRIYYGKYPSILSIESLQLDITYFSENEISYPEFNLYSYYYTYTAKTFEDAKEYAKLYANYLESNGYEKIYDGVYKTVPVIGGEPSHIYELKTPDGDNIISIMHDCSSWSGNVSYLVRVDISPTEKESSQVPVVDRYQEGYDKGYGEGYDEGYSDGEDDGYSEGYDDGYEDGKSNSKPTPVEPEQTPSAGFDRDSVSEQDMEDYLESHVSSTLTTPLGTYTFRFDVTKSSDKFMGYDFWIKTSQPLSPSWYDMENSIDLNPADVAETVELLRNYQVEVYEAAYACAPGAKMKGGFHSSWYKYPAIKEGYESTSVFSWVNYGPIMGEYDETSYTGFEWNTQFDDYKF